MADVSSNNGQISVANYSRAGHCVIAVKASEGTGYTNPDHFGQCNEAHDFGLTVVHYHFCRPGDTAAQISHFREVYNKAWRDGDYACFDIEIPDLGTSFATRILKEYLVATQREPLLYTYKDFFEKKLHGVQIPGNRCWIADYSPFVIRLPKPYQLWAKQYTDGVEGPEPHFYSGIGKCDGSEVTAGVARVLQIRKIRTRRKK